MALRAICVYPDPVLREETERVEDFDGELKSLIDDKVLLTHHAELCLTLAIRDFFACTSFSYVLLRLNHCHVSKYAAPGAVRADDGDKISVRHAERQIVQSAFLVDRSGIESFGDILQLQHASQSCLSLHPAPDDRQLRFKVGNGNGEHDDDSRNELQHERRHIQPQRDGIDQPENYRAQNRAHRAQRRFRRGREQCRRSAARPARWSPCPARC